MRRTGWFSCSDERINRLHEAAVWSFRDNACDIPTDCPHRERAGWIGDWQLYVPTAAFLYDVAGFSDQMAARSRRRPVARRHHRQHQPGRPQRRAGRARSPCLNGSAGWEDAAVIVPWELYRAYGDTRILAELWPTMVAWMDKVASGWPATAGTRPRAAARPEPAPHEQYLWDTGFHWGEWLVPGEDLSDFGAFVARRQGRRGHRVLRPFGRADGPDRRPCSAAPTTPTATRELAERARAAWRPSTSTTTGGSPPTPRPTTSARWRSTSCPTDAARPVADRLVELIRAAGTHLGTGFLATPYLLPVLADTGHLDVAYELLPPDTEPSWLTMIDRGATTVWERWNGVDADGVPHESLNHYSKGAVISFLHRYVAGIELLDDGPAYRRFRIRPRPGGGLPGSTRRTSRRTGGSRCRWRLDADGSTCGHRAARHHRRGRAARRNHLRRRSGRSLLPRPDAQRSGCDNEQSR